MGKDKERHTTRNRSLSVKRGKAKGDIKRLARILGIPYKLRPKGKRDGT